LRPVASQHPGWRGGFHKMFDMAHCARTGVRTVRARRHRNLPRGSRREEALAISDFGFRIFGFAETASSRRLLREAKCNELAPIARQSWQIPGVMRFLFLNVRLVFRQAWIGILPHWRATASGAFGRFACGAGLTRQPGRCGRLQAVVTLRRLGGQSATAAREVQGCESPCDPWLWAGAPSRLCRGRRRRARVTR